MVPAWQLILSTAAENHFGSYGFLASAGFTWSHLNNLLEYLEKGSFVFEISATQARDLERSAQSQPSYKGQKISASMSNAGS